MLVEPNNSPAIGHCNLNYVETHLWENLPRSQIGNSQPTFGTQALATNYLRTAKLVNIVPQSAV